MHALFLDILTRLTIIMPHWGIPDGSPSLAEMNYALLVTLWFGAGQIPVSRPPGLLGLGRRTAALCCGDRPTFESQFRRRRIPTSSFLATFGVFLQCILSTLNMALAPKESQHSIGIGSILIAPTLTSHTPL